MMRLACALILPLAVLLIVACGGGTEEPPDPDSFADGLTAEEILERSSEASINDANTHIRSTGVSEILGVREESSTETIVIGEDVYVILSEGGEPTIEMLRYRGESYIRDPGELAWERRPEIERVSALGAVAEILCIDLK